MGMYTGLRFKGTIKPEYREVFEPIAMNGEWEKSSIFECASFGEVDDRASFIPCGYMAYMPDEWFKDRERNVTADEFERFYNEKTGKWVFSCALKNYGLTITRFFEYIVPEVCESVEYCELYYEEWEDSEKFELINEEMVCTDKHFIKYKDYNWGK